MIRPFVCPLSPSPLQRIGERQRSEWDGAGVYHVDAGSMRRNLRRYVDQMPTALRALGGKAEDKAGTARLLGAAVQHAVQSQVPMRTVDVWDEQRFHAVKIPNDAHRGYREGP